MPDRNRISADSARGRENAYEMRHDACFAPDEDPRFDPLRDDPRYFDLLK